MGMQSTKGNEHAPGRFRESIICTATVREPVSFEATPLHFCVAHPAYTQS